MYAFNTPSTLNFVQPRRGNIVTIEIINYSFGDLFFPEERAISRVVRPDTLTSPRSADGGCKGETWRETRRCPELVGPDVGARRRDAVCAALSLACLKLLYFKYAERRRLAGDCVLSTQTSMLNAGGQRDRGRERAKEKAKGGSSPSLRAPCFFTPLHPRPSERPRAGEERETPPVCGRGITGGQIQGMGERGKERRRAQRVVRMDSRTNGALLLLLRRLVAGRTRPVEILRFVVARKNPEDWLKEEGGRVRGGGEGGGGGRERR